MASGKLASVVVGAVVVGGAIAGCSSADKAPAPAAPATTTTAAGSAPTAKDGKNYAACADGNCEVTVSGPVKVGLRGQGGIDSISVTKVDGGGISFALAMSSGSTATGQLETSGISVSGGLLAGINCTAPNLGSLSISASGTAAASCVDSAQPQAGSGYLTLQAQPAGGNTAVLRMAAG